MLSVEQILAELLESLTRQVKARGREDDFCSLTIQPGVGAVVDFGPESDCRGSGWVRLVSANPTAAFPAADTRVGACAYTLAFTVEIGMVAPAPMPTDRLGKLLMPTDEELFDASMRQAGEMQMMFDALRTANLPQMVVGDYVPQGPEGGVLGGTWSAQVGGDEDD